VNTTPRALDHLLERVLIANLELLEFREVYRLVTVEVVSKEYPVGRESSRGDLRLRLAQPCPSCGASRTPRKLASDFLLEQPTVTLSPLAIP
jgi:hypothetical protein